MLSCFFATMAKNCSMVMHAKLVCKSTNLRINTHNTIIYFLMEHIKRLDHIVKWNKIYLVMLLSILLDWYWNYPILLTHLDAWSKKGFLRSLYFGVNWRFMQFISLLRNTLIIRHTVMPGCLEHLIISSADVRTNTE